MIHHRSRPYFQLSALARLYPPEERCSASARKPRGARCAERRELKRKTVRRARGVLLREGAERAAVPAGVLFAGGVHLARCLASGGILAAVPLPPAQRLTKPHRPTPPARDGVILGMLWSHMLLSSSPPPPPVTLGYVF